ncbi:hypothetical protein J5U18_00945 [Sphingobacteriaceae bacterium WQ 2009]|uniref:Uncharacterized protein n=1 Tax=Rhinopithecimicrobium faecis TaxID=2820698 RepID=A0A8T4H726_9SPHI|nr:hypothetical protein [Sphingobacteriaceae bacterium WQ 2009]
MKTENFSTYTSPTIQLDFVQLEAGIAAVSDVTMTGGDPSEVDLHEIVDWETGSLSTTDASDLSL